MNAAPYLVPGAPRLALDLADKGPLLLLMHGIGGNRSNWRTQRRAECPRPDPLV